MFFTNTKWLHYLVPDFFWYTRAIILNIDNSWGKTPHFTQKEIKQRTLF